MSELKVLTLHKEIGKYAYYHVESLNTKVILVNEEIERAEMIKLVQSLEAKQERECPFLIIVDNEKKVDFDNLSQIAELAQKGVLPTSPVKESFKIQAPPKIEMPFIEDYRPSNIS